MSPSLVSRKSEKATLDVGESTLDVYVYTVRVSKLLALRGMAKGLATAVLDLMSGNPMDMAGETVERDVDQEGNLTSHKQIINPVGLHILDRISKRKQEAVEQVTHLLLDPANYESVCDLLADSCRDNEEITTDAVKEASADNFALLVTAMVKVNKAVFDPLLNLLSRTPQPDQEEAEIEETPKTPTLQKV